MNHRQREHIGHNGGVTVIQLLLTILVAGTFCFLAYGILAPIPGLTDRGNDNGVANELSAMRSQAEVYYIGVGKNSYGTVPDGTLCANAIIVPNTVFYGTSSLSNLIKFTYMDGGYDVTCAAGPDAWSVNAKLPSGNSSWCVDNFGSSKAEASSTYAKVKGCA